MTALELAEVYVTHLYGCAPSAPPRKWGSKWSGLSTFPTPLSAASVNSSSSGRLELARRTLAVVEACLQGLLAQGLYDQAIALCIGDARPEVTETDKRPSSKARAPAVAWTNAAWACCSGPEAPSGTGGTASRVALSDADCLHLTSCRKIQSNISVVLTSAGNACAVTAPADGLGLKMGALAYLALTAAGGDVVFPSVASKGSPDVPIKGDVLKPSTATNAAIQPATSITAAPTPSLPSFQASRSACVKHVLAVCRALALQHLKTAGGDARSDVTNAVSHAECNHTLSPTQALFAAMVVVLLRPQGTLVWLSPC